MVAELKQWKLSAAFTTKKGEPVAPAPVSGRRKLADTVEFGADIDYFEPSASVDDEVIHEDRRLLPRLPSRVPFSRPTGNSNQRLNGGRGGDGNRQGVQRHAV